MDGIDGMIASQGIVYGSFLYLLLPPENFGSRLGLILAAGCAGFLMWNWAPAKIFLGDVGSGPIGLLFVLGGAFAIGGAPVSLVFLPLFPLFLDAFLTLVARMRARESVTESHRGHLYQRIANAGMGHAIVTSAYGVAAAVGAIVAISARDTSPMWRTVSIIVYLIAVGLAWTLMDKRYPRRRDLGRGSDSFVAQ
jgi:Fuc2NAc and GlcNAc transferase